MKRYCQIANVAIVIMIVVGCKTGTGGVQNRSRPPQATSIDLFNGKDLGGWYTYVKGKGRNSDPRHVFTVHDGMIHITGEDYGCITTEREFGNYTLEVEYKWGAKTFFPRLNNARDNGILLHSVGVDGGYDSTWMHSIECQIIEGGTGDFIVVGDGSDNYSITSTVRVGKVPETYFFDPKGTPVTITKGRINWYARDPDWSDTKSFRGRSDVEKPVGQWNMLRCIAQSDSISIFLNGKLVNKTTNVKPSRGRIQIQSEGAEIFFRKVIVHQQIN
jgi:hypothetical protein